MIITIIIAILAFVGFAIWFIKTSKEIDLFNKISAFDIFASVFLGFLIFLLVSIIGIYSSHCINVAMPKEQKRYSKTTHKIVALKDNQSINGRISGGIVITTGHIEGDLYYFYSEQTKNGIVNKKIKASNCHIKYSDNPKIVIYSQKGYKKWYHYLYATPFEEDSAELYIPKGSITNEFKVDLE